MNNAAPSRITIRSPLNVVVLFASVCLAVAASGVAFLACIGGAQAEPMDSASAVDLATGVGGSQREVNASVMIEQL